MGVVAVAIGVNAVFRVVYQRGYDRGVLVHQTVVRNVTVESPQPWRCQEFITPRHYLDTNGVPSWCPHGKIMVFDDVHKDNHGEGYLICRCPTSAAPPSHP